VYQGFFHPVKPSKAFVMPPGKPTLFTARRPTKLSVFSKSNIFKLSIESKALLIPRLVDPVRIPPRAASDDSVSERQTGRCGKWSALSLFRYLPRDEEKLREEVLIAQNPDFIFLGHTHIPFIKFVGNTAVVNPGSVGQPKDGDPRAAYAE
jgi:Calcineurin-like phosphoesterase superfamily domain